MLDIFLWLIWNKISKLSIHSEHVNLFPYPRVIKRTGAYCSGKCRCYLIKVSFFLRTPYTYVRIRIYTKTQMFSIHRKKHSPFSTVTIIKVAFIILELAFKLCILYYDVYNMFGME